MAVERSPYLCWPAHYYIMEPVDIIGYFGHYQVSPVVFHYLVYRRVSALVITFTMIWLFDFIVFVDMKLK
jgi:hypothetical protein